MAEKKRTKLKQLRIRNGNFAKLYWKNEFFSICDFLHKSQELNTNNVTTKKKKKKKLNLDN